MLCSLIKIKSCKNVQNVPGIALWSQVGLFHSAPFKRVLPFTCNKVLVTLKAMLGKKQFKRILILASWDSLLARLFLTGRKYSPLVQTLEARVTSLELWMWVLLNQFLLKKCKRRVKRCPLYLEEKFEKITEVTDTHSSVLLVLNYSLRK